MTYYPPNTQLFASSPPDDSSVDAAKKYISDNGYTNEQVKLVRNDNYVAVIWR